MAAGLLIIAVWSLIKHLLKDARYLNDTFNYAFATVNVWRPHTTVPQLLFDAAVNANSASSPPLYPSLYRFIIMRFPGVTPLRVQSISDWLAQSVVFVLLNQSLGLLPAAVAVAVFNLSPLVFSETLYFTDRLLAATFLWANLFALHQAYLGQSVWAGTAIILGRQLEVSASVPWLLMAFAAHILLILTHKHSVQLLVICYAIVAIAFQTLLPLVVLAVGEIVAAILSLGYSLQVHRGHLRLLQFGWHKLFPADGRGGYGQDQLLFQRKQSAAPTASSSNVIGAIRYFLRANWEFALYVPLLAFVLAERSLERDFWAIIFTTTVAVALLTQFWRPLKFIGEGSRYLEYAVLPATLAVFPAYLVASEPVQLTVLVLVALWCLGALYIDAHKLLSIRKHHTDYVDSDFDRVVEHVASKDWDRFIIFPIQKTYAFAWRTNKRILHFLGADGFWQAQDWFPQIKRPIPSFYEEYDVRHILLDERYVRTAELELGRITEIHRQGSYVVYRIER